MTNKMPFDVHFPQKITCSIGNSKPYLLRSFRRLSIKAGSVFYSLSFFIAVLKSIFTFVSKYYTVMFLKPILCMSAATSSENGENHCGFGCDVSNEYAFASMRSL